MLRSSWVHHGEAAKPYEITFGLLGKSAHRERRA